MTYSYSRYTKEILNSYLYDQLSQPSDQTTEAIIRPSAISEGKKVPIDQTWYMTDGPGQFGYACLSPIVDAFFAFNPLTGTWLHEIAQSSPFGYDKISIKPELDYDFLFSVQQYDYDGNAGDFAERVFIWGTSGFSIGDSVRFHVDANGNRFITDLAIRPLPVFDKKFIDDFDFVGGVVASASAFITMPLTDPSHIGRTVQFDYGGLKPAVPIFPTYTYQDFLDQQLIEQSHHTGNIGSIPPLSLYSDITDFLSQIFADATGPTHTVDSHGRAIFYGTDGDDRIVANAALFAKAPLLADHTDNGVVLVGGGGADVLTGADSDDHLLGGKAHDVLVGGDGKDTLEGGADADTLVGGDGVDALYGGDGTDVLVLGNINGVNKASSGLETVDGGAGTDYIVVTGALGSTVTVGKGDAGDRLLIHASLLGKEDGGDGKIGMFNLLGGVYLASPGMEREVPRDMNADCNVFKDAEGKEFRAFYLELGRGFGLFSRSFYSVDVLTYGPAIEYRLYEDDKRLEIRIMEEIKGEPVYIHHGMLDPNESVLQVLQTIEISDFADGDYGIHLPPVFLPFGEVTARPYYEDTPELYYAAFKLDVMQAYSKAWLAIKDNAFAYSLAADGTLHGAATASLFASVPEITAENLVIAIDGGDKADVLAGNDRAEHISGGGGDDVIRGEGGADVLDGGNGFDTLDYSTSKLAMVVNLALGTASDGDAIFNFEAIMGSAQADHLTGDAGTNRLVGGFGADVLDGGFGFDFADYSFSFEGVIADLAKGQGLGGDAEGDTLVNIEGLTGSALRDILIGDAAGNTLDGGAGNDTLIGGNGGDVLRGGDGVDLVDYRDSTLGVSVNLGNGTGSGGDADGDTLIAIENLKGSQFNDVLVGSDANNTLDGHDGDDLLAGGLGDDRLNGGAGQDTLRGDAGADVLVGGLGVDVVDYTYSDAGVTVDLKTGAGLGGAAQGDLIAGVENLTGSLFADILSGDVHDNLLLGGLGADTFVFDRNFGHDTIGDFEAGTDRVRLSGTTIHSFNDLLSHATQTAGGVQFALNANDSIDFTGLNLDQIKADDFIFA